MNPQGRLLITVHAAPTHTDPSPSSETCTNGLHPPLASLWAGPRGTCGGEATRKASRGGGISSFSGCKRPLSSVPAGTRGCASAPAATPGAFRNRSSPRPPGLLRAPVQHPSFRVAFSWVSVHLPPDSELLQVRTRLLPSACRAQSGCPEPEAGRATESSTPGPTSMKQDPGTTPPPRPYHCSRDSLRCRTALGSFVTEQVLGRHCKCQPSDGTRAAAQVLSRLFRGCPPALDGWAPAARPPARTRRSRQPFPA